MFKHLTSVILSSSIALGAIIEGERQRQANYQQIKQSVDTYIQKQVNCLGLNIYHEARSSSPDDQKAVALVTINRVKSEKWPDTVCEVVYQRKQFSWTHTIKDPTPKEAKAWKQAISIAEEMYAYRWKNHDEYQIADFTAGANHYYQPEIVGTPVWAKSLKVKQSKKIGSHVYLKIEF